MNSNRVSSARTTPGRGELVDPNRLTSTHRYLDVMTVRTSQGRVPKSTGSHTSLLIEPILIPSLDHVNIEPPKEMPKEKCLFYPDGHKSKSINREIENAVRSYSLIEHSEFNNALGPPPGSANLRPKHKKSKYADLVKEPLYYKGRKDNETANLIKSIKDNEGKIRGTVTIRL